MTLAERLADAHQRSVALYLQRQQLEQQRQTVLQQIALCEQALLKSDGEIDVLTAISQDGSQA
jgi:hypothetical protein